MLLVAVCSLLAVDMLPDHVGFVQLSVAHILLTRLHHQRAGSLVSLQIVLHCPALGKLLYSKHLRVLSQGSSVT